MHKNNVKKIQKLIRAKQEQEQRLNESLINEDVKEKRAAIGDTLRALHDEIDALMEMARDEGKDEGEDDNANDDGNGQREDNGNEGRSFRPIATYGTKGIETRAVDDDFTNSMEYRTAFKHFVATGEKTRFEGREDATTLTSDVWSVIPTVILNRIIEGLTTGGMILSEVTRTAFAAGLVVPTSSVRPVATWVAEGAGSDSQKKTTGGIVFGHYKLRCEVAMSAEVDAMAVSAFEAAFVANVVDAMTAAIEGAILYGDGTGKPIGILSGNTTSLFPDFDPDEHVVTITGPSITYADLVNAESLVPVEYDNTAKWFMTKKDFMQFVGMVDDNGQPIARVDYGIADRPVRRLLGREVIVHPYADAMGGIIAGIFDFRDYVFNTIYDLGIQRRQNWDNEDHQIKAVMAGDGKPVSLDSLVIVEVG